MPIDGSDPRRPDAERAVHDAVPEKDSCGGLWLWKKCAPTELLHCCSPSQEAKSRDLRSRSVLEVSLSRCPAPYYHRVLASEQSAMR
jgi:hypothetical protein